MEPRKRVEDRFFGCGKTTTTTVLTIGIRNSDSSIWPSVLFSRRSLLLEQEYHRGRTKFLAVISTRFISMQATKPKTLLRFARALFSIPAIRSFLVFSLPLSHPGNGRLSLKFPAGCSRRRDDKAGDRWIDR